MVDGGGGGTRGTEREIDHMSERLVEVKENDSPRVLGVGHYS